MASILKSLVQALGSKKLTAVAASALTMLGLILLKAAGSKVGLTLSDADVAHYAEVVAGLVIPYLLAQWHIDVSTDGKTTTAFQLAAASVAPAAPAPAPAVTPPVPPRP